MQAAAKQQYTADCDTPARYNPFGQNKHVVGQHLTHCCPPPSCRRDFSDQIRNWVKGKFKLNSDADFDRMARVYVYHKHISDDLYPRIYKSANSVVLPTR
jgi:hypothetical protein